MNLFIQGMRRSGTTIAFDLLLEDRRFDCYYEPLAKAGEAYGGGSGVREADLFESVRQARREFMEHRLSLGDPHLLNYGAPRNPVLEFEPSLPEYVEEYINFMCERSENAVIKFTRMAYKVETLRRIDPNAHFVHIVRDPRAVATSYLYGKNQRNRKKFNEKDLFFKRCSTRLPWSSYAFSEILLNSGNYSYLDELYDFERILLIWKDLARVTHESGLKYFEDRYHLLRHEDLMRDAKGYMAALYEGFGWQLPKETAKWADDYVRYDLRVHDPAHPAWVESIQRFEMEDQLREFGYELEL